MPTAALVADANVPRSAAVGKAALRVFTDFRVASLLIVLAVAIAQPPTAGVAARSSQPVLHISAATSQPVKVAEGELVHRPRSGRPMSHAWILWRLPEGGHQIDAVFSFVYDRGERRPQARARYVLDQDLRLLSFEHISLPERPQPMMGRACRLEPHRFACSSGRIEGDDPDIEAMVGDSERSVDVDGPYDVWGFDAWAMARWTRLHPLAVGASVEVRLLGFSRSGGEEIAIDRNATVRRLGPEPVDVLGASHPAEKYELQIPIEGLTRFHVWVAPDGIPLYAEIPSGNPFPPYRIELLRLERYEPAVRPDLLNGSRSERAQGSG
jgi:hypothetical protein